MSQEQPLPIQVVDQRGQRGTLDLNVLPPNNAQSKLVLIRFSDGSSVFADASLFVEKEPGVVFYPGNFAALLEQSPSQQTNQVSTQQSGQNQQPSFQAAQSFAHGDEHAVIPVLEEQLRIARERIVTGGVRVHKTVSQRVESVNEPVVTEHVEVERIAVNRFVQEVPTVRYEGDTMIVPMLEEVLVVEKRLVLREEIRLHKRREVLNNPQEIVLRREEVRVERVNPNDERAADNPNTELRRKQAS